MKTKKESVNAAAHPPVHSREAHSAARRTASPSRYRIASKKHVRFHSANLK